MSKFRPLDIVTYEILKVYGVITEVSSTYYRIEWAHSITCHDILLADTHLTLITDVFREET